MIRDQARSPFAKAFPLPFGAVSWTGGLWRERFETVGRVTVPHLERMFDAADVSHVTENFRIAAGEAEGAFAGTVFGDGDFYKWTEAAVCTAVRLGDQELLDRLEDYIALFRRAQRPDGYLSTKQIIGEITGQGDLRQASINDFEVYNMGHLFTAACVYTRATGRDSFLRVAEGAAGYLKTLYETAAATGEVKTAVCPSHYMGLADLYRLTGNRAYLDLCALAVKLRDSVKNGLDDNQDRLPLRKHREIIGHAVRANYLYAGLTDLYLEEGDPEYREVLDSVWRDLTERKIYIAGGCGALYNGASPYGNFFIHQLVHQAYGYPWQLPNVTAYNETCATLGGVFWAWRRFLAEPRAEEMDLLERMLLNACLAGISLDGKKFFYANALRRADRLPYELVWGRRRTEYLSSCCCPPNLARTLAQAQEYAYAADETGVWTGLYGESRARFRLENGAEFTLIQETEYPFSGSIRFSVRESNGIGFELRLRVPAWAEGARLSGREAPLEPGYHALRVDAPEGFTCRLELPFAPRLTVGHDLIEEVRGQACVERGPLVFCLESAGLPAAARVPDVMLPEDAEFRETRMEICGREVPVLETELLQRRIPAGSRSRLYRPLEKEPPEPVTARLIPYYAWDNREDGEMTVWMPLALRTRQGLRS